MATQSASSTGSVSSALTQHLDSASQLEWKARQLARGVRLGKHASKKVGIGMEFHSYRNYVQGDDVRLLDWKMYAKTQDYLIKQADVERNQQLHIHMDTSKSMDYTEGDTSKIALAKLITATLTHVMARQGDQFSWSGDGHGHSDGNRDDYNAAFATSYGLHNWRRSILQLDKLTTHNSSKPQSTFVNEGLLVWITDLYLDIEEIRKFLLRQVNPHTEIVVFHLIGKKEEDFTFESNTKFVDLETQEEIQVNAKQYAEDYKARLGQHILDVKRHCLNNGIVYEKIYLQDDLQKALQIFLANYNRLT